MSWGDFHLELISFQRSKISYDVAVDILDNADGDCHLTFIVRDDLYSQEDVDQLSQSYVFLAKAFAAQPSTPMSEAGLCHQSNIEEALNLGRGQLFSVLVARDLKP